MKKFKFLKIFGLAMIVSLAVYNVGLALNVNGSGDTALKDVEALADDENGGNGGCSCSCPLVIGASVSCPTGTKNCKSTTWTASDHKIYCTGVVCDKNTKKCN
jgi:hypothetical protein